MKEDFYDERMKQSFVVNITAEIEKCITEVAASLCQSGKTLATAESCTGGWLAKACTDFAGSSAWFSGSIVAYTEAVKTQVLGVNQKTIDGYGIVSRQVAEEMAIRVKALLNVDVSIGVTGYAGPSGGDQYEPKGCVWVAVCQGQEITSQRYMFEGSRASVRLQSVLAALVLMQKNL